MKKYFLLLALAGLVFVGEAQENSAYVQASGKITNHATHEPVVARISYRSEPYGNIVGVMNGFEYAFPLYGNVKFTITAEASGFSPSKHLIDPATANADRKVILDIELGKPLIAAPEEATIHHVGKVIRLEALIFQQRSAIISPESYPELNTVAGMLDSNPNMVIQLEGHTDTRGDARLNLKLSEQRVDAVRDYLIRKGVNKSRVKLKAFGGSMPLSRENTEEAHKLNRRVEARIIEN